MVIPPLRRRRKLSEVLRNADDLGPVTRIGALPVCGWMDSLATTLSVVSGLTTFAEYIDPSCSVTRKR